MKELEEELSLVEGWKTQTNQLKKDQEECEEIVEHFTEEQVQRTIEKTDLCSIRIRWSKQEVVLLSKVLCMILYQKALKPTFKTSFSTTN